MSKFEKLLILLNKLLSGIVCKCSCLCNSDCMKAKSGE